MIEMKNATKYFQTNGEKKYILKNVNFVIPENVNLGILGRNGAGKSTLLRMLGGIDFPTSGTITSDKTFSWPMGLAGGFQGSMTGRQNVKFVCRIYGKSDSEIAAITLSVQEFAELGDYFDMPIKIYSSGMRSRLSFGLSLAFDFDYMIIDETLSVGDENFKKKSKEALQKKIENCNVLLVSHSMNILRDICDAGIVVNAGKLQYFDKIEDAIEAYHMLNESKPLKETIYCEDGNSFKTISDAAKHYQVRGKSIKQALEQNYGSHAYLKKVFWREGNKKAVFHDWPFTVENETIISSDGMIFDNALEASLFYKRSSDVEIGKKHVANIMENRDGYSKVLDMKFQYLSEFK